MTNAPNDPNTASLPSPGAGPTPDHTVTLADGRTVAVDEHGRPDGPVVVLVHSSPGSRLLDPDPAATAASGVRLLTLDRAGFNDSSPVAPGVMPCVADRADDVVAVLRALDVTDAAVVGWSHGGHIAVSLGARHPELVRAIALAATPAPDDDVPWVPDWQRTLIREMRSDPATAVAKLTPALADLAADPAVMVESSLVGEADRAAYATAQSEIFRYFAAAARQGAAGLTSDIVAMHVTPWGFDPRAVGAPVHLFYGDADDVVPLEHSAWWHGQLADSTEHPVPGAGHLLVRPAWKDILGALT